MNALFQFTLRELVAVLLSLPLLFYNANAQEPFQIKWSMDYSQVGASDHANFTPADAALLGGANAYTLSNVYSAGGAVVVGYIIRPWPVAFSASRAMEFVFAANSFKYSITSFTFRLRRSESGPNQIKVRTSADNFTSDIDAFSIGNLDKFNSYVVPVDYPFLSENTFAFRIYAYDAPAVQGVLWFDEIIVNGLVHPIILPVNLTYFKAAPAGNHVELNWETVSEKNSSDFVVEKSTDLISFEEIGTVPAAGKSEGRRVYHFKDNLPVTGASYYRLRLVDKDGSFAFSQTLDVLFKSDNPVVKITPNPADPEKIIITGNIGDPQTLQLTSSAGAAIAFDCQKIANNTLVLRPLTPIPAGLYLLYYQKNIGKEHVKILVR